MEYNVPPDRFMLEKVVAFLIFRIYSCTGCASAEQLLNAAESCLPTLMPFFCVPLIFSACDMLAQAAEN
jgi:hypothetical protein